MKRIKIYQVNIADGCYECGQDSVWTSNETPWEEVDDTTYEQLLNFVRKSRKQNRYGENSHLVMVVEPEQHTFIAKCIEDYIKLAEKEEATRKKRAAATRKARETRRKKEGSCRTS